MTWDVNQYERYRDERSRPFFDLLSRVRLAKVARAVDLGCGTGELTAELSARWPDAQVTGVDSSAEMLAAAQPRAVPGKLAFERADAAHWAPPQPVDLWLSNATFQWLDDHDALLRHAAAHLAPGGAVAVQMPGNFDAPSHRMLAATRADGPWAERLAGMERGTEVHDPSWYVLALSRHGFVDVDAWETTYIHMLSGADPVLEWMKGTALRPVLARLTEAERPRFLDALAARLRDAYPAHSCGTLLPFRRIFFVATRA